MAKKQEDKTLTAETYQLVVMALAQLDYAAFHGDGKAMEAAVRHARQALTALGEPTEEEEVEEAVREDEDEWDDEID